MPYSYPSKMSRNEFCTPPKLKGIKQITKVEKNLHKDWFHNHPMIIDQGIDLIYLKY